MREEREIKQIHLFSIFANERTFDLLEQEKKNTKYYELAKKKDKTEQEQEELKTQYSKIREEKEKLIEKGKFTLILNDKVLVTYDSCKNVKEDDLKGKRLNKNIVSIFESALTRELGIEANTITKDIFLVKFIVSKKVFNKKILSDGFSYNSEKYVFYTCSSNQMKQDEGKTKAYFIKESLLKEHFTTLMNGLTIDKINKKGGMISNKYLSYLALTNSSSYEWKEFDTESLIDRCVLVKDFETNVTGCFDYIDKDTFEITRKYNQSIPITHTDGVGMIDARKCNKTLQIRLPWIKGLLVPVDFKTFCDENSIKELNGKNINDIDIIFTESQVKTHSIYNGWEEYQQEYKKNHCKANIRATSKENEEIEDKVLSYQMLQTLTDITEDEIKELCTDTNTYIHKLGSDKDTILDSFGSKYQYMKEIIELYPNLLGDGTIREILKDIRKTISDKAKCGKIRTEAKYTYIVPDVYAWMQNLFLGIENPTGILQNDDVSTNIYENGIEMDCLRSPHCSREHFVTKNVINEMTDKYFNSNCLYTSCHSLITKVLQADCDGDTVLCAVNKTLVKIAKRNMGYTREDTDPFKIVPLYYEMPKKDNDILTNDTIFDGLLKAWTSKGIQEYSGLFTRIWNNRSENNEEYLKYIKWLCLLNNFEIDFTKTLYKPTDLPTEVKEMVKECKKIGAPYFFRYKGNSIVCATKVSCVDRLEDYIEKIEDIDSVEKLIGKDKIGFDKTKLMKNKDLKSTTDDEKITKQYIEYNKKYYKDYFNKDKTNTNYVYAFISKQLRQPTVIDGEIKYKYTDSEICDILVKNLYNDSNINISRKLLFMCYKEYIYRNLKRSQEVLTDKKTKVCAYCGKTFIATGNKAKYCSDECKKKANIEKTKANRKKKTA